MGQKHWHALEINEVLDALHTSSSGLTAEEARHRLERFGPNEVKAERRISPVRVLLNQFKNWLILILLVATVISLVMGEMADAIVIFAIVLASSSLGFIQEYRAEKALKALKQMAAPVATAVRDGIEVKVPAREIVPGDIITLWTGDKVSADARLIEVVNMDVDEAPLTGESVPVSKALTALPQDTAVSDRINMVFSGTTVTYGKGKATIVATGMNTEFGKIAKEVAAVTEERTPLERRMDEIGRKLGVIALVIVATVAIVGTLEEYLGYGYVSIEFMLGVFMFSVALAVAAVPEALPAIVTGSLAVGMHMMAKRNALVRKMPTVETLGSTQVVCSDKTGTLTKGEMTARRVYVDGKILEVTGVGYEPKGEFRQSGEAIYLDENSTFDKLARALLLCNDAKLEKSNGRWSVKGDPTEGALVVLAEKAGFKQDHIRKLYPRVGEVLFSSERKRMTTIHVMPDRGRVCCMKGAPEVVLNHCNYICIDGRVREIQDEDRERILKTNEEMARDALRVLGVAERELPMGVSVFNEENVERDLVFLGLAGMIDPPREEAVEAVQVAKQVSMTPIMITGDHKLTAVSIGKEMGIYRNGDIVLTGVELDKLTDEAYEKIIDRTTVYARVSPTHKLRIVNTWKKKGQVVAMTGDGVNDAPALKHADIGIAMGISGTDVAKEASKLVLADDNFATIIKAVELGRRIYDNIQKYLTYLLQANLVEIVVMSICVLFFARLFGLHGEEALPLIAVQLLYINLATDGLPAIALGFSPAEPDIMRRPPRPPNEPVFTRDVKYFLIRAIMVEVPIITLAYITALPEGIDAARTRLFLIFVFVELVVALNCRSLRYTIDKVRPHKWLVLAVLWETALIVTLLHIPAIREALKVGYPTLIDVAWTAGASLATVTTVEILKRFNRG